MSSFFSKQSGELFEMRKERSEWSHAFTTLLSRSDETRRLMIGNEKNNSSSAIFNPKIIYTETY